MELFGSFAIFVERPVLALIPAYAALMLGDLIGDVFWYWIGRKYGLSFVRRYGKYLHLDEQHAATVEEIFHKHSSWIIILSKVTMGFGFALITLITAGMSRIPFRRYILLNAIGQFVWTAIIMALGFFLSHLFVTVDNLFARISVVAFALVFVVCIYRYAKFIRSKYSSKLLP